MHTGGIEVEMITLHNFSALRLHSSLPFLQKFCSFLYSLLVLSVNKLLLVNLTFLSSQLSLEYISGELGTDETGEANKLSVLIDDIERLFIPLLQSNIDAQILYLESSFLIMLINCDSEARAIENDIVAGNSIPSIVLIKKKD